MLGGVPAAAIYEINFADYGRDWSDAYHGFWDDAIAGSSALQASLRRSFDNEVAIGNKLDIANGLWDLWKYYDTVDIVNLVNEALSVNFHPVPLFFCVLAYMSPRTLRADKCHSRFINVYNRIPQGCGQAPNMARALLHNLLDAWHRQYRPAQIRQYYDDLAESLAGTKLFILKNYPKGAEALVLGLRKLGLEVSPKSAVVTSGPKLTVQLNAALKLRDIPIQSAVAARDLGLDNTAGVRRSTATQTSRSIKAVRKAGKLKRIR